jgi:hypothetical protein
MPKLATNNKKPPPPRLHLCTPLQVKEEGYEVAHDGLLVTVFSAPNYCDQMGNKGAFVRFNGNDMVPHFTTFEVGRGGESWGRGAVGGLGVPDMS